MRSRTKWTIVAVALGLAFVGWLRLRTNTNAAHGASESAEAISQPVAVASSGRIGPSGSQASSQSAALPPPSNSDGYIEIKVFAFGVVLSGTEIELVRRGERDANTAQLLWTHTGSGVTDATGTVRIAARTGRYAIIATHSGWAPATAIVYHPQGEFVTRAQVHLQRASALEGRTVTRRTKLPAPLVQVLCTPYIGGVPQGPAEAPAAAQRHAQSDANGYFTIPDFTPGIWQVEASVSGGGRALMRGVVVPRNSVLVLELVSPSYIEGHVLSPEGPPAAGAEIAACGAAGCERTLSSDSGAFSVEVSPGGWHLTARRGLEAGAERHAIAVAEGETRHDVVIRLEKGGSIAGLVVRKRGGAPLGGARILISPHNDEGDSARAVSGADGTFAATGLAPGSYDATAVLEGYQSVDQGGISLLAGQQYDVRFELGGTGSVEGKVIDDQGMPIDGALVEEVAGSGGEHAQARTDSEGAYRLVGVPSGPAHLLATRSGSKLGVSREVTVKEDATVEQDFVLKACGRIVGRVTRATGSLPDGVLVAATRVQPKVHMEDQATAMVAADGSYELELPAGPYRVSAGATDGPRGRADGVVSVEPDQTVTCDLVLPDAAAPGLTVQVLEPGGAPSPMAKVSITSASGPHFARYAVTDTNGEYALSNLRDALPDNMNVVADNGARYGTATVGPGVVTVAVQLQAACTLSGTVVSNSPITAFSLDIRSSNQPAFLGDGNTLQFVGDRFEVPDQTVGTLQLHASTPDGRSGDATVTLASGETSNIVISLSSAPAASR